MLKHFNKINKKYFRKCLDISAEFRIFIICERDSSPL